MRTYLIKVKLVTNIVVEAENKDLAKKELNKILEERFDMRSVALTSYAIEDIFDTDDEG